MELDSFLSLTIKKNIPRAVPRLFVGIDTVPGPLL